MTIETKDLSIKGTQAEMEISENNGDSYGNENIKLPRKRVLDKRDYELSQIVHQSKKRKASFEPRSNTQTQGVKKMFISNSHSGTTNSTGSGESSFVLEKKTDSIRISNNENNSTVSRVALPILGAGERENYQCIIKDIDKKLVCQSNSKASIARLLGIKGTYLQKLGELEKSIAVFEEALSHDDTSVFVYTRLGESYRLLSQYDHAIQAFEKAMETAKESAFLYSRYGAALYDANKDLDEAKKLISRSYRINPKDILTIRYACRLGIIQELNREQKEKEEKKLPTDPDILFRMGFMEYKRGGISKATSYLDEALKFNPVHVQSLVVRGEINLGLREFDKAKQDFENATRIDNENSSAMYGLANCYIMLGERKKGIDLLDKIIDAYPGIVGARILRGEEYRKMQRHQDAYNDFNESINLIENHNQRMQASFNTELLNSNFYQKKFKDMAAPFNEHKKNLAFAYGRRGMLAFRLNPENMKTVIEDFDKASELDPNEPFVLSARGSIGYERGDYVSAKYYFNECLRHSPKHTLSLNTLGEIARLEKDYTQAKNYLKKSIDANPNNAFAYERLGDIYRETRETLKALKCLNEAIKLKPKSHFALSCRGDLLRSLNRLPEAYRDLNAALSIEKDACTFSNLGEVYRLSGVKNYAGALKAYNEAIKLDKTFSFAYFCKAKLYAAYEKYDDAIKNINISIDLDGHAGRPQNYLALLLRANIFINQGNFPSAYSDLSKANKCAAGLPDVHRYWTIYWYRSGNLKEALKSITQAIQLEPGKAINYGERAKINLFLRNIEKADEDVNKALEIDDSQATALSVRGILASLDQSYSNAINYLNKAINTEPRNGFSHAALGEVYRITKDYEKAKMELKLGIRYSPKSPIPNFLRGVLHFEIEEYGNAIDDFDQFEEKSINYFSSLSESKEILGVLVTCMRLIIFLKASDLTYSESSAEKYKSMLEELDSKIPSVDLEIFRELPTPVVSCEMREAVIGYINRLVKLLEEKPDFYVLSSISILYLLIGEETKMKGTINTALDHLKLLSKSIKNKFELESISLGAF